MLLPADNTAFVSPGRKNSSGLALWAEQAFFLGTNVESQHDFFLFLNL